jgi:hypothetical protein
MGLFGQGGSSTLGFSDYVLVVSRHRDAPDKIGFTLIRILALDTTYRDDAYAYLVVGKDSHGTPIVPSVTVSTENLKLYEQPMASRIANLEAAHSLDITDSNCRTSMPRWAHPLATFTIICTPHFLIPFCHSDFWISEMLEKKKTKSSLAVAIA